MSIADRSAHDILLIEDNPGDVRLVREAFHEATLSQGIPADVHAVSDGEVAMDWLTRRPGYDTAVRPDLILLDLNLPRMNGRTVLSEVRSDPALTRIPVIVLTTSDSRADILNAYALHANCFITKPADIIEYFDVIAAIARFWLRIVKLPPVMTP